MNVSVETDYTYDLIGRLTSLEEDTTTFAQYAWTYGAYSRVTQFTFSHLVGGSGTSDYSYDHTGQLIEADHSNQTDQNYDFDEAGNRTNTGYSTGDNNRMLSDGRWYLRL